MTDTNEASTCIDNVPDEVLLLVAEYLTAPARALFAIGCFRQQTAAAAPPRRGRTEIIVSQTTWDTLDFGQLDKDLARMLTDHDLSSVLLCIDATNTVKTLKLTGCINIIGWGLHPLLAGSAVIEAIDLSMLRDREKPRFRMSIISEPCVVPILARIIEKKSSSLKHVQFPKHWREGKSALLTGFLGIFDAVLKARNYKCSSKDTCDEICGEDGDHVNQEGDLYGIQNYICSVCTKPFCCDHGDYSCGVDICEHCERVYCTDCGPVFTCEKCDETACVVCTFIGFCSTCDEFLCMNCGLVQFCEQCETAHCSNCLPVISCSKCYATSCIDCGNIMWCDDCEEGHCFDCVPTIFCSGCHATSCIDCCNIMWCDGCEEGHCFDCLHSPNHSPNLHCATRAEIDDY